MARIDSFEVSADNHGGSTFELYSGQGESRERICEERIRDTATALLWLQLLTSEGELEYDEAFESLRLRVSRKAGPALPPAAPAASAPPGPSSRP
jgi:hypothetical protein